MTSLDTFAMIAHGPRMKQATKARRTNKTLAADNK